MGANGLAVLPALVLLNDHLVRVLLVLVLAVGFVRLVRAALVPVVEVAGTAHDGFIDALLLLGEGDLDLGVVISELFVLSEVHTLEGNPLVDPLEHVHVLINIDVSAPLMGDSEQYLGKNVVRYFRLSPRVQDPLLTYLLLHLNLAVDRQQHLVHSSH